MDRAVASSQLILEHEPGFANGLHFELANASHDAVLRCLLRDSPMYGSISVSLEQEPSFFAAEALRGLEHHTIVALENNRVVATGSISARRRFINGEAMRVGYLSGLRLSPSYRGRADIIRRGYEAFRKLHEQGGPPIYFSSIIADNMPARRFLERGLRGMPTYRFLGELVTLVIRRRAFPLLRDPESWARREMERTGMRLFPACDTGSLELASLLNGHNRHYQFAPAWSGDEVNPGRMHVAFSQNGTQSACAGIWDQRAVKQTVVRGYSGSLRWTRPFVNFAATMLGAPHLPSVGATLSNVYVSHLAADPDRPELAGLLTHLLLASREGQSADYLTLAFDSRDSHLPYFRKTFRAREYTSRMYVVYWDDEAELAHRLDDRLLAPEVATL